VTIYETITLPVVLYGCKSWTVSQGPLDKLEAFNNRACRMINNRNLWHLAHARVQHHQYLAAATGRNANHDKLSRTTATVMAWSRRPNATITHPKATAHGRVCELQEVPPPHLLTYGKSITNMMKLVAYAFPTQPSYSSLNPDAAIYVSSTHTDSHNQQRTMI
jgi:hypothetical protein